MQDVRIISVEKRKVPQISNSLPFDPLKRARDVEKIVMIDDRRAYYRFRFAKFYGGIITGDSVGCNLLCGYCWNYSQNANINEAVLDFYGPDEVAEKIKALMDKHKINQYRISGCEPFLGLASAKHLGAVIRSLKSYRCIIESNGVMIGYDPSLLQHIPKKAHFRITIKADSKASFESLTGAKSSAFKYQLEAIRALTAQRRPFTLAFMKQFVSMEELGARIDEAGIELKDESFIATDREGLMYYPQNTKSMKERGIKPIYSSKEWKSDKQKAQEAAEAAGLA